MKTDKKINVKIDFGKKLAEIRKAKGITQKELADKIGTSQRMIAYYEGPSNSIPIHLLPPIAKALKVSTDELLGVKSSKEQFTPKNIRLWRKLRNVEKLSPQDQKNVLRNIEAFLKAS